jgi:hypothetical protein
METVILGTRFRSLKTKPILLKFDQKTGHVQLLNALASPLQLKPHRWVAETHERVTREINSRPRDIHIAGAHHLSWRALEVLRDLWDETGSEGPRRTLRIVMAVKRGFARRSPRGSHSWPIARESGFIAERIARNFSQHFQDQVHGLTPVNPNFSCFLPALDRIVLLTVHCPM